jgi:hypothetical protein
LGDKMNLSTAANQELYIAPSGTSRATPDILTKFVRALATRQARIDAGLNLNAANDNEPRTLH